MSESTVAEATNPATAAPTRVRIGSPIYNEVLEFLYDEACMLDEIRLQDWAATLIMGRVMRLSGKSAWAEDPPSRTRRLVTNVRVERGDKPDEYKVRSYLLVTRSRFNFDEYDLISAERHDVLRQVDGVFKLARREILLDQAVLGTPNLAIFL
jgi:3-phenylpropionate/cinnamic acid dioxygenase small subunit